MTPIEKKIANCLLKCSFLPGSFDKKFVNQLPEWADRPMTKEGRDLMIKFFHRYRKQISGYKEKCKTFFVSEKLICEEYKNRVSIPNNFAQ